MKVTFIWSQMCMNEVPEIVEQSVYKNMSGLDATMQAYEMPHQRMKLIPGDKCSGDVGLTGIQNVCTHLVEQTFS